MSVSNALVNFLMKNLDSSNWSVYSANPDSHIDHRFALTLKAEKDNVLFDEKTGQSVTIKKNGHLRGLVEPKTSCMRVLLYIEPSDTDAAYEILQTRTLTTVVLDKRVHAHVLHSYIPDKQKAIKLQHIENETVLAKKMLTDTLPYEPGIGVKYIEHVSNPDFKKRWKQQILL